MLKSPKPFYVVDLQTVPPACKEWSTWYMIAMASIWPGEGKTVYSCSCIIYKMPQDKINCTLRVKCCFPTLNISRSLARFPKTYFILFLREKFYSRSISSHRPLSKYILVLIPTFSQFPSRVCVLGKERPPIFSLKPIFMPKMLRAHAFCL